MEIVNLTPLDEIKVSSLGPGIELLMNDKKKSPSRSAIGPYSPRSFYGKTKKIIYGPGVNRQSVNQYLPSIMNTTNNAPIRTRNSPPKRYEPTPRRRRNNNNTNAPAPSARRLRV